MTGRHSPSEGQDRDVVEVRGAHQQSSGMGRDRQAAAARRERYLLRTPARPGGQNRATQSELDDPPVALSRAKRIKLTQDGARQRLARTAQQDRDLRSRTSSLTVAMGTPVASQTPGVLARTAQVSIPTPSACARKNWSEIGTTSEIKATSPTKTRRLRGSRLSSSERDGYICGSWRLGSSLPRPWCVARG